MQSTASGKTFPAKQGETPLTKLLRIMKMSALLLLIVLQAVARPAATTAQVTLKESAAPLEKVLVAIKKQSNYDLFFNETLVKLKGKAVAVNVDNVPVEEALAQVFKNQDQLTYTITGKIISIKEKKKSSLVADVIDFLTPANPPGDITGKVTDKEGNPLNGALVKVKGTNKATSTAIDGVFVLKGVDENAKLEISFIGYETIIVEVNNKTAVVASLNAVTQSLQDVVVSKGYYTVKQRENTGNVSVVKGEDIQKQPVSDPIQALIGRVPGLVITQTSGIPGAYSTVRIRGQNSIANGNSPLYIIDGTPFSSNSLTSGIVSPSGGGAVGFPVGQQGLGVGLSPFNSLNPSDIDNIEILKDGDATAIYGSRGANGVILITTKKGRAGDSRVDINISQGVGSVARTMDLLNTQQYLAVRSEAFKNDGLPVPSITTSPTNTDFDVNGVWDNTRYTNWQKVLIGNTANYTNAQANVSGGNANTQFMIGVGYNRQTTVYPGDYSDRKGSVHLTLTHASLNQRFHLLFTASYVNDNNIIPQSDFTRLITLAPDAPALYNLDGSLNWQILNGSNTWQNPLAATLKSAKSVTNNLITNMNLSYELLPGLEIKSSFGYTDNQMNQTNLNPASSFAPPNNNNSLFRSAQYANTDFNTWIIEPQLNYHRKISRGRLEILLGSTFQENVQNSRGYRASGYASDALLSNPLSASTFTLAGNQYTLYHYNAIYGRINYNWEEKYLLNITARRDGSSRFGPGNQFGNFGAIGTGWVFSKEKFANTGLPWLSFGKLRGSYGITGNDQTGDYQFLSTYSSSSTTYLGQTGLSPTVIANPNLGWEQVTKLEGGLELSFLKDRINLTTSYYRNRTTNSLISYPLPSISGFSSVAAYNLPAVVQNSGLELTVNTINIKAKDFSWTSTASITIPENKLVSYPGLATSSYSNIYVVGQSLFIKKLWHYTGIDPQNGAATFVTANANGIPSSPQDIMPTQPVTQKFYGGFQNNFSYKGFSLDIFIQFVKQNGPNYLSLFGIPGLVNYNQPTVVLNRWQKPGDNTNITQFSTNFASKAGAAYLAATSPSSDATISDASFIRLKNLALSYQLPSAWQQRIHMRNARLFLQAQNLITITNYLGMDPETQGLVLPTLRMITIGFSTSF